jgi:lipopolysaccharide/colanic/teichoic acid biosynthesis glycosyltransferase
MMEARSGVPRPVEVVAAMVGLVLAAPLIGLAALAVKLSSTGPALFRQQRVGRGGKTFVLLKLRTMTHGAGGMQVTAGDDARITGVGRVLRRLKLDELPELANVLRGDMSFVGPRPEVAAYVELEDPLWQRVLAVRPGLTDPVTLGLRDEERLLAAVEGDRDRFYREVVQPYKLRGYLDYLTRRTAWSDLTVIGQTVRALVWRRGGSRVTLEEMTRAIGAGHGA